MYNIALYENGMFTSLIGQQNETLQDVLVRLTALAELCHATPVDGVVGFKYDRNGSACSLLVLDEHGEPIYDKEDLTEKATRICS